MEGKDFIVSNLYEEAYEDNLFINKVGVHKFRHPIKKPLVLYFYKDYG
jgi:hypothetical protein